MAGLDSFLPGSRPKKSQRKGWLIGDEYSCTNYLPPYSKEEKKTAEAALAFASAQDSELQGKELEKFYEDTRKAQRHEVESLKLADICKKYYWLQQVSLTDNVHCCRHGNSNQTLTRLLVSSRSLPISGSRSWTRSQFRVSTNFLQSPVNISAGIIFAVKGTRSVEFVCFSTLRKLKEVCNSFLMAQDSGDYQIMAPTL